MADYKEMYLHLMRVTEAAVNILIDAQRYCEELYIKAEGPELRLFEFSVRADEKTMDSAMQAEDLKD